MNLHDKIAKAAYDLYEKSGKKDGCISLDKLWTNLRQKFDKT